MPLYSSATTDATVSTYVTVNTNSLGTIFTPIAPNKIIKLYKSTSSTGAPQITILTLTDASNYTSSDTITLADTSSKNYPANSFLIVADEGIINNQGKWGILNPSNVANGRFYSYNENGTFTTINLSVSTLSGGIDYCFIRDNILFYFDRNSSGSANYLGQYDFSTNV